MRDSLPRPEASCNQIGGLLAFAFIEFDRAVLQNDCRADDKLQLVWDCYEKKTYEVNKKRGHKTKKKGDASVTVSANADSMDELHQILKLAGIDFDNKGEMDHDHEEESPCDQDDEAEGGEEGPVVVSLKPQSSQGYNSIGGDKKEILNALMNRYKSL